MTDQLQQRKIKNQLKRLLKSFNQYKLTDNIIEAQLLLLFDKEKAHQSTVILIDDEVKEIVENRLPPDFIPYFLKPKNKRNRRTQAVSNLNNGRFISRNNT